MADIFISYNREDRHSARAVATALEAERFSVWWDAALRAGESYDEVTERNLREAKAVVVLWSKKSINSKWVRAEATIGERHSTLVPAMIEECDRPLRFELIQTADLTRWHGDRTDPHWRDFIRDVGRAVGREAGAGHTPAHKPPAAASGTEDATIETTFWTSVKDGDDPSDFQAYLERYPTGHFASLARNRLAALERGKAPPAAPKPMPQPAPRPAPQQAAAPKPRPAPAQPARPAAARAPQPIAKEPKKGGANPLPFIVGALLLAGVVGGIMFFPRGDGELVAAAPAVAPPPTEETTTASVAEAPSEPAVDQFAVETDATELSGDAEVAGAPEIEVAAVEVAAVEEVAAPVVEAPAASDVATASTNFQDCDICPAMVVVPAGQFAMGSPKDEPGRNGYEGPQKQVSVAAFAIGAREVTAAQWMACVDDGGCNGYKPGDEGFGGGDMPVMNISWRDAQSYIDWLSKKTGRGYRLPTEAEWEYAARGGTDTAYWWGARFDVSKTASGRPKAVGSHDANGFGLYDVTGNVREWVEDCYVNNYAERPDDARAVTTGDCSRRVIRGGAWSSSPADMRIANRIRITSSVRDDYLGFRVAADVD